MSTVIKPARAFVHFETSVGNTAKDVSMGPFDSITLNNEGEVWGKRADSHGSTHSFLGRIITDMIPIGNVYRVYLYENGTQFVDYLSLEIDAEVP
jgi:hypothetical protein